MTALRWVRLAAGMMAYTWLAIFAYFGCWFAAWAARLDCQLDDWRHELQRRDGEVERVVAQVAYAVRHGATSGSWEYDFLDARDMDQLARAIDNLGCYAQVWPWRLQWRRRDLRCNGARLGLHALAPADRDAFAEAIGNLDGEAER